MVMPPWTRWSTRESADGRNRRLRNRISAATAHRFHQILMDSGMGSAHALVAAARDTPTTKQRPHNGGAVSPIDKPEEGLRARACSPGLLQIRAARLQGRTVLVPAAVLSRLRDLGPRETRHLPADPHPAVALAARRRNRSRSHHWGHSGRLARWDLGTHKAHSPPCPRTPCRTGKMPTRYHRMGRRQPDRSSPQSTGPFGPSGSFGRGGGGGG